MSWVDTRSRSTAAVSGQSLTPAFDQRCLMDVGNKIAFLRWRMSASIFFFTKSTFKNIDRVSCVMSVGEPLALLIAPSFGLKFRNLYLL